MWENGFPHDSTWKSFNIIFLYTKKAFWKKQHDYKRLIHICLVDPSILINWTSPFPILRMSEFKGCPMYFFVFILFRMDIPVNNEDPYQLFGLISVFFFFFVPSADFK